MSFLNISRNRFLQKLASVKITVVCLFLLFVLTFWGTVAQVNSGLYAAQERYFSSLIFFVFGFIPIPGAQLVLWVLFVNLLCVTITRFVHYFKARYAGILTIHCGLLLYFVAAFVTFHVTIESNVHLMENEGTNLSSSYHDWELSIWKDQGPTREVMAYDAKNFRSGQKLTFKEQDWSLTVLWFYPNARAFTTDKKDDTAVINASGIQFLEPQTILKEREKNVAGVVLQLNDSKSEAKQILLYGGETKPTRISIGNQIYFFSLRHKRHELPLTVELMDFRAQFHPGTDKAKSFESTVRVTHNELPREVIISMNEPFRFKDYTFYQASYAIDSAGNEYSTFAVVKNAGRLLPYIASFWVFGGLVLHFLIAAFGSRTKRGSGAV